MKRQFPVCRALHDGSERHFSHHYCLSSALPLSVDLRPVDTPVRDQKQTNACTGYAWAGLYDFYRRKFIGYNGKSTSCDFVYRAERVLDGDVNADNGSTMKQGGVVLATVGFCREQYFPSTEENIMRKPSLAAYANALIYRNKNVILLTSIQEMKQSLFDGFPFVLGIDVPRAMMNIGKTGIMSDADWNTEIEGSHALMCVGYNEYGLIIRNSWGTSYGDGGYFQLPWFKVDAADFDCYTIR